MPPLLHILNNQELCRRGFGGWLCFNVPTSPYQSLDANSERRISSLSHNRQRIEPSAHLGVAIPPARGPKANKFNVNPFRGSENRGFEYEVEEAFIIPPRELCQV